MTANGPGAASSKNLQKATRTAALTEADTKNKAAQSLRDPPEAATPSGEDPVPTRTLKARAANVYNTEWAPHEQAALDQAAVKFPADRYQPFERYVRIAAALPRKGVRDVALRLRWLSQARKRKVSEEGPNKRLRRDRCHSIFATQQKPATMMQQWPQPQLPMPQLDDHGAQTVGAVGGLVAQLLEQNLHILYQYKQNMHQFKVQENTELLVRFRDNILAVLNQMSSMDGVMSQMPQLPVRMNVELANNFLPAAAGTSSMFSMGVPNMSPGMNPQTPVSPVPGNGFMGQGPANMGSSISPAMQGAPMQSMPAQSRPAQSVPMQSMPSSSMPVPAQPQPSQSAPPVSGTVVRAGPPPAAVVSKGATQAPTAAAAASAAAAAKSPAHSASSNKGAVKAAASVKPPSPTTAGVQAAGPAAGEAVGQAAAQAAGLDQATSSGSGAQGGLRAVASAVSAGKSASPAPSAGVGASSGAKPAVAAAKPQSAASKSLAASASKVAAGMASKAAAAKAGKQKK